jgi:F-type H+-transporting ATPase subunit delta
MKITRRAKRDARRLFRLCMVNGVLEEPRVRYVVQRVVAAGRGDGPAILAHFKRLVRLELARHTAVVESATRLPANLEASIETGLRRRYGPGLTTAFAQSPALIGGLRIQVGSDVLDGSVRAELSALEKSL